MKMKKIGTIIAGVSMSVLLLFAGAWADITLTDSGSGPGFKYETSPDVSMDYKGDNNADWFGITSVNSKGTMEYGVRSDYDGYYQHSVKVGSNATTATNSTIAGWTKFGK